MIPHAAEQQRHEIILVFRNGRHVVLEGLDVRHLRQAVLFAQIAADAEHALDVLDVQLRNGVNLAIDARLIPHGFGRVFPGKRRVLL